MGNVCSCSLSLDNLLICCFDRIVKQPNFAFELGEHLALLTNDWDKLKRRRNDIKEKIEVEEHDPYNKRLQEVDGWCVRVDEMEAGVDSLIRDASQESVNKCLVGCCPKNCKTSYRLGKKVAKMQLEVTNLLSKGTFDTVSHKVSLPPVDERPSETTLGLESTLDEVWSFIEDEQVRMIGLYGMGGVGKTTLLTEVNNKLSNLTPQGFDVVIWIVVSQTPNLSKLQDVIGKKIGLDSDGWKNKSQENKAYDIFRVLKEKKFVLLLDDLWERLDLKNLGVPSFPNQNNKSKVVITTRSKEVCGRMGAHKCIEVKCLTWEDAWNLFTKNVGNEALKAHPEILKLANDVAKECDGLPLALITIGRAMACKTTLQEWDHALNLLKRYTSEFSGIEEEVFSRIKFSYDSLRNNTIRSCFLYCSLYPEDYEIPKKELIHYWIGEGFLVKFNNWREARNEGYDYISTLVHASLLEECTPENVKMHDVIRDTAIWIACDCGARKNNFFVKAGAGLREIPNVAEWEGAERVSLMHNEIEEVTGTPNCPNLLTLFLNDNCGYRSIASGFFQYMPNLRVLNLSGNYSGCISSILKEICELVTLQYLDLSWTGVEELPTEFQNLINLKYLNLSDTEIRRIQEGVLSSFKKLKMLKLYGLELGRGVSILMKELESLEYLNDLEIDIESDFGLSDFLSSQKLMRITIVLRLTQFRGTRYIDMLVLKEMRHLESLQIKRFESLEELRMGKGKAGFLNMINHNYFPQLRNLVIVSCRVLKDITWLAFAPNLETIDLVDCSGMKEVVGGWKWDEEEEEGDHQQINMEIIIPFAKLTSLDLSYLPELESIYPTALPFPCLKYLEVLGCSKLKKLPFNSSSSCKSGISIEGREEWWNGLEWEDEATRLAFLPSFTPCG